MTRRSVIPDSPTFDAQPPDTPISQLALRLLAGGGDIAPVAIGTAVWLGSHIALTAAHNTDHIGREYMLLEGRKQPAPPKNFSVRAYQLLSRRRLAIWNVQGAWPSDDSDLAILTLEPNKVPPLEPSEIYAQPQIRMQLPKKGAKVLGFGYRKSRTASVPDGVGGYHLRLDDLPQGTTGIVTDVFPYGRDRRMYTFPCIQVNARFDSGMSGGPVFNEDGELIGIISGSLPPGAAGEEHVSYVAAIWPTLRIQVGECLYNPPKSERPAIELARDGIISVRDPERLDPLLFPNRNLRRR